MSLTSSATGKAGRFLAFDTSTERMSIAIGGGAAAAGEKARIYLHEGPGGAQASATLIPAILQLLGEAGLRLHDLEAIAFGRGPGSFTGLRCACAVAQGLAFGAGLQVIPIDTLMTLAEEARFQQGGSASQVTALLDARMDEMYVQHFTCTDGKWQSLAACTLVKPEDLQLPLVPASDRPALLAGNVFAVYEGRLPLAPAWQCVNALPSATAMLRLAPKLMAQGQAVSAAEALPLYIRDKVASTTEERALAKAASEAASLATALIASAAVNPG